CIDTPSRSAPADAATASRATRFFVERGVPMPTPARSSGPLRPRLVVSMMLLSTLVGTLAWPAQAKRRPPPAVGRWNLTVTGPDGATFPSWLEITFDDAGKLGGRLCGRVGVPRALARVE